MTTISPNGETIHRLSQLPHPNSHPSIQGSVGFLVSTYLPSQGVTQCRPKADLATSCGGPVHALHIVAVTVGRRQCQFSLALYYSTIKMAPVPENSSSATCLMCNELP